MCIRDSQYISKEINLENNATSLKIVLDAHIHQSADVRAFYAISDRPGMEPIFTPFPGYKNLNSRGQIIQPENSDGSSDKLVEKSNDYGFDSATLHFREYTFTEDDRWTPVLQNTSEVSVEALVQILLEKGVVSDDDVDMILVDIAKPIGFTRPTKDGTSPVWHSPLAN